MSSLTEIPGATTILIEKTKMVAPKLHLTVMITYFNSSCLCSGKEYILYTKQKRLNRERRLNTDLYMYINLCFEHLSHREL